MPAKLDLPEDEIVKLYVETDHTSHTLAEKYGCSNQAILVRLKKRLGVETVRKMGRQKTAKSNTGRVFFALPLDELRDLYLNGGLSPEDLTEHYGCPIWIIRARLRKVLTEEELRQFPVARNKPHNRMELPEEEIAKLYVKTDHTARTLAKKYGCSTTPIKRILKERLGTREFQRLGRQKSANSMRDKQYVNPPNHPAVDWSQTRRLSQKRKGRDIEQLCVLVTCPSCGKQRWQSRKYVFSAIGRGRFTGRCRDCIPKIRSQSRTEIKCAICGRVKLVPPSHAAKTTTCGRPKCVSKRRSQAMKGKTAGPRSGMWTGGKHQTQQGYILVHPAILTPKERKIAKLMAQSDGCVLEHRLVVALHLNRPLEPFEIVHHKNGIKDDNRLENLKLTTRQKHTTVIRNQTPLKCPHCGHLGKAGEFLRARLSSRSAES